MINNLKDRITKKTLLSFSLKVICFVLILFALDFFLGKVLAYYYFKQNSGILYRTTYSIEKTNADLLIFGSSRANHHYSPDIFENRLNISAYNAGREASFMFYHYAVLQSVLKRYTPNFIILDFTPGEFREDKVSYEGLSSLLPYYKRHPEIRSVVNLKGSYEKVKLISNIYPFNSQVFSIAIANTKFNLGRVNEIKGYVPLSRVWKEPVRIDSIKHDYKIDTFKVKAYNDFIRECIEREVTLYIACSPSFVKSKYADKSIMMGQEIAREHNVPFYDHLKDSIFVNNPTLFWDTGHLNKEGAKLFTNILIDEIW